MGRSTLAILAVSMLLAAAASALIVDDLAGRGDLLPDREQAAAASLGSTAGTKTLAADETAWIRVSYPVPPGLEAEDVEIRIRYVWGERDLSRDNQFWGGIYVGRSYRTTPDPPAIGARTWWIERGQNDGAWGTSVQAFGEAGTLSVPDPVCTNRCYGNRSTWTISVDEWISEFSENGSLYDRLRADADGPTPTVHVLAMAGGMAPDRFTVDVAWSGTEVRTDRGGAGAPFTFDRDDFRYEAYAATEVPGASDVVIAKNGSLTVRWSETPTIFWYHPDARIDPPFTGWQLDGSESVVAPNGSTVPCLETFWCGASAPGRWRFGYEHRGSSWDGDGPVLFGSRLRWG